MGRHNGRPSFEGLRQRLAQESARLMIEHGIADFGVAKRKAAERFAVRSAGALPTNAEIEQCLAERQRIFEPITHAARIGELRRAAAQVMDLLAAFEPRLAGPVLAGTATINSTRAASRPPGPALYQRTAAATRIDASPKREASSTLRRISRPWRCRRGGSAASTRRVKASSRGRSAVSRSARSMSSSFMPPPSRPATHAGAPCRG